MKKYKIHYNCDVQKFLAKSKFDDVLRKIDEYFLFLNFISFIKHINRNWISLSNTYSYCAIIYIYGVKTATKTPTHDV